MNNKSKNKSLTERNIKTGKRVNDEYSNLNNKKYQKAKQAKHGKAENQKTNKHIYKEKRTREKPRGTIRAFR